jgi:hypothetical protein
VESSLRGRCFVTLNGCCPQAVNTSSGSYEREVDQPLARSRRSIIGLTSVGSEDGSSDAYEQIQWALFPRSWTVGLSTSYSSAHAIQNFNAGH